MRRDAVYAPSGAAEDLDFEDDVVFPPDLVDALNGNVRISKRVYSGDPRRWAAKPIHPAGYKDHVLWLPASIWEGYVKNDEVLSQLSYDEGTIMLKCQVIDKIGSTYTLKCLYDNEDEDDFEASMCATFTVGKPGQSYSSSKKRKASSKAPAAANGATGEGGADDTVGEEEGGDSDEEEEEYRDLSDNEEAYGGRPEYQAEEEEEEEHQVQEQDGLTHDGGVWAFDALEVPAGGKTKRPQRCVACSDNSASIFCVTCCDACTTSRDPSDFAFCNSKHKECWSKHVWETCESLHASNTPTAPVSPPAKKRRASTGSMTGPTK